MNKRRIYEVMKSSKSKANFFIAFPVNDVGIREKVKQLQEKVISKNPILLPALVNISTLHITLAVMHLSNMTDIETIKNKLNEWAAKNIKTYFDTPCVLTFRGIKTFRNVVAYVDLEECINYKKLVDISKDLNSVLSSTSYFVKCQSFTPHLTFLKLSKDFKLLKKKKQFTEDFESLKNCDELFGRQEVSHVQLLSMDDPLDEHGYYKCLHEIKVSTEKGKDHGDSESTSPIQSPQKST